MQETNITRKYLLPILVIACAIGIATKYHLTKNCKNITTDSNELIFTKEEESAISKWQNKSMDRLAADALSGDAAGLWMIGMLFLTGSGDFPIDMELANHYFAQSASLGFAPALDQLRRMYSTDKQNLFLALVYLNLTISEGHSELLQMYHDMREKLLNAGGSNIMDEVEKIAIHKKSSITRARNASNNPEEYIHFLSTDGAIINEEDVLFDRNFWAAILSGHIVTGNLEIWLKDPDNWCRKVKMNGEKAGRSLDKLASWERDSSS